MTQALPPPPPGGWSPPPPRSGSRVRRRRGPGVVADGIARAATHTATASPGSGFGVGPSADPVVRVPGAVHPGGRSGCRWGVQRRAGRGHGRCGRRGRGRGRARGRLGRPARGVVVLQRSDGQWRIRGCRHRPGSAVVLQRRAGERCRTWRESLRRPGGPLERMVGPGARPRRARSRRRHRSCPTTLRRRNGATRIPPQRWLPTRTAWTWRSSRLRVEEQERAQGAAVGVRRAAGAG